MVVVLLLNGRRIGDAELIAADKLRGDRAEKSSMLFLM
jgi:hypothetical protein